jgi:hypothetical protein
MSYIGPQRGVGRQRHALEYEQQRSGRQRGQ